MTVRKSPIVPGATYVPEEEARNDLLGLGINTVDNVVDDVLGMRPLRHISRVVASLMPANVIRNVTGIPKPSEMAEGIADSVEEELGRATAGGGGIGARIRSEFQRFR